MHHSRPLGEWSPVKHAIKDPTSGHVSKGDVEVSRGIQNKHEARKQIAFNYWVPKAGDGLSHFSGGRGWCSADRAGDSSSLALLAAIFSSACRYSDRVVD